jgi:hypothetical protein
MTSPIPPARPMAEPETAKAPSSEPKVGTSEGTSRRWLPLTLVVVASLIGLLAVFSVWAKRQLLETDSWVDTSAQLLEQPDVQRALADYLVDELYANVDVEAEIASLLPKEVALLAGPAAGGLRQVADQVALEALENPRVQALWADANRAAHNAFIQVIEGGGPNVSTSGGDVTLDLTAIVADISSQLGLPGDLASKLPPQAAQLEIIRSDELGAVQDGVDFFQTLYIVLVVLTFALYAAALYLAGGRRRETLRAIGYGFVAIGVIVLVVRNVAGDALVTALTSSGADEPAAQATWTISTSMLSEGAGAVILYGIAIIFSAWLAGPTSIATRLRGAIAPYLRQPRLAYGGLALLVILLFWWSPTQATERLVPSLILVALLILGTEILRRRTIAEFPDRVGTFSAAGMAQTMASQTRESIARRTSTRTDRQESEVAISRIDALERIGRLRESGVLSDAEFEAEKARLLGPADGATTTEEV